MIIANMPQDQNIFLHLMKSYLDLPAHLQKCFSYCSIFPQNHKFEVEELVLLWMAEGFIQPRGARRLEDIGIGYFDDLYSRSLFQECESTPNLKRYKMHDLIHDMAQLVSRDICIRGRHDMLNRYPLFGDTCHLSLFHEDRNQPLELKAYQQNKRLRTFLVMNKGGIGEFDPQLFSKLQSLRVLGLSGVGLLELPDKFDDLKYIRYLNLSENWFSSLPKSICKLVALEVLKLRHCSRLCVLPEDMKNLVNLRHLDLDVINLSKPMPPGFRRFLNLQFLSVFVVGTEEGRGIEELENLNFLRGSLCIRNIEGVSSVEVAEKAKLIKKTGLQKLELQWEELPYRLDEQLLEQRRNEQAGVLKNLQPHENLKELVIKKYSGIVYPDWLSESLHQLTSIHLEGLKYCNNLPSLGELCFLESFIISNMPSLKYVDHNFHGSSDGVKFPSLKSFQLHNMPEFIEWTHLSETAMPRLVTFTLYNCPRLISLPPRLRSPLLIQQISNCPGLLLFQPGERGFIILES